MKQSLFLRKSCQNYRGFTAIELILATLVGVLGTTACVSIYSYIAKQNHAREVLREMSAAGDNIKRNVASGLNSFWISYASTCSRTSAVTANALAMTGTNYTAEFINYQKISTLIPATSPRGGSSPLYLAVQAIKSANSSNPANASNGCSNSKAYPVLADRYQQQLCRCALAVTVYGTLWNPSATSQTSPSPPGSTEALYACLIVTPSQTANPNQAQPLLKGGRIIVEAQLSIQNVTNGTTYRCNQLAPPPALNQSLRKLSYLMSFNLGNHRSLSLPGALVME